MIKGHAKIELTNVHTGEKDVVEHTNLFTDAIKQRIADFEKFRVLNHLASNTPIDYLNAFITPMYNNALGGILLFENNIDENVNNYGFPSKNINPLVGYASNNAYSGLDTQRGSRNDTETEVNSNSVKYVWDFLTSQANGQISALALSSIYSGRGIADIFNPYSNANNSYTWISCSIKLSDFPTAYRSHLNNIIDVDFDNFTMECAQIITEVDKKFLEIVTCKLFDYYNYGLFNTFSTFLQTKIIDVKRAELPSDAYGSATSTIKKGDDGYIYIFDCGGVATSPGRTYIYVNRVLYDGMVFDPTFCDAGQGYKFYEIVGAYISFSHSQPTIDVLDGNIHICNKRYLTNGFKINMSTKEYTDEVTETSVRYEKVCCCCSHYNGMIIYDNHLVYGDTGIGIRIGYGDNMNFSRMFLKKDGSIMGVLFNASNYLVLYFGFTCAYLATINNLDSPVTKTNAQTMKITYTLTEV